MPKIPSTFCPAKWDEVHVNLNYNYVYSCCKATPIKFGKHIDEVLNQQKENLLNGVQDSSCDYCWKNENAGQPSLRQSYLRDFDVDTLSQYKNNTIKPVMVEVYMDNACNFQCIYCNPKYSSLWETDVRIKSYPIFSDKHFYDIDLKNKSALINTIDWLHSFDSIEILQLIGGEPLINKHFFQIVSAIKCEQLLISTNLSSKTMSSVNRIFEMANNFKEINLSISIDSTGKNAEFARYGMNFEEMLSNIYYVLENAPKNVTITFNSLMTSFTIRDLTNTAILMDTLYNINKNIKWQLMACHDPMIMQLTTLQDIYKPAILQLLAELKNKPYVKQAEIVEGTLISSKFNNTLYQGLKHFLNEFSTRKNIAIPICLK